MISPDTNLYIYEIKGDLENKIHKSPSSFVGLWNEDDFSYLFFSSPEEEFVTDLLLLANATLLARHEMKYSDWQVGLPDKGLTIHGITFIPPFGKSDLSHTIIMDPSVVFGDGNHATTKSCLGFLMELYEKHKITSLLDLGTGTGILALVAAHLGIKKIIAVDKNVLAVETAKRNVSINCFQNSIQVTLGEARLFIGEPLDVVLANLPFSVLKELLLTRGADNYKFWIVSGINKEQSEIIKQMLVDMHYEIVKEALTPPWLSFLAAKD